MDLGLRLNTVFTRLLMVASLIGTLAACSGQTPLAPDPVVSSPSMTAGGQTGTVSISGAIYVQSASSNPPIADAVIEVVDATGSRSTRSRALGSYALMVLRGDATITASKEGYESKTWPLSVSKDTVLNFGLVPK